LDLLSPLQELLDRRRLRPTTARGRVLRFGRLFVLGIVLLAVFVEHEVGGVQERALFGPDVDERGLDAR
jgi:hypothetical protein